MGRGHDRVVDPSIATASPDETSQSRFYRPRCHGTSADAAGDNPCVGCEMGEGQGPFAKDGRLYLEISGTVSEFLATTLLMVPVCLHSNGRFESQSIAKYLAKDCVPNLCSNIQIEFNFCSVVDGINAEFKRVGPTNYIGQQKKKNMEHAQWRF